MTKDAYEQRLIAYVDILGWGNASEDLKQFARLKAAVEEIKKYARNFSPEIKQYLRNSPGGSELLIQEHGCIEFSFFSDNFAVSVPVDQGRIIFKILAMASHVLLCEGFLVRGGVTIGNLYHDEDIIFGPALVEAVRIEQNEACNPCLRCSKEVDQYLEQKDYKNEAVLLDFDDKLVVNIAFGSVFAESDLMIIIEREFIKAEKFAYKWRYLKKMLPKMYKAIPTN